MKVRVIYFKASGKFYTQSEEFERSEAFHDLIPKLIQEVRAGPAPGLAKNWNEAFVIMAGDVPHLVTWDKF